MNSQTFSIGENSAVEACRFDYSDSSAINNYLLVASPIVAATSTTSQNQHRDEIKQRLSSMRKRTRVLLAKHDWQRFFVEDEQLLEHLAIDNANNSILTWDLGSECEDATSFTDYTTASVSPHVQATNGNAKPPVQNDSKLNLFSLNSVSDIPLLDFDSILLETNNEFNDNNNYNKQPVARRGMYFFFI
jgi:hypothetical protein